MRWPLCLLWTGPVDAAPFSQNEDKTASANTDSENVREWSVLFLDEEGEAEHKIHRLRDVRSEQM